MAEQLRNLRMVQEQMLRNMSDNCTTYQEEALARVENAITELVAKMAMHR